MAELQEIRGSITDVAYSIKNAIVKYGLADSSAVVVTAVGDYEEVPHHASGFDIVIQIRGEVPVDPESDVMGRWSMQRIRKLLLVLRSRVQLDPSGSDEKGLLADGLGHIAQENRLIDCLQCYWPEDVEGNTVTACPMHFQSLSQTERERKFPEWLASRVELAIHYERQMSQTWQ